LLVTLLYVGRRKKKVIEQLNALIRRLGVAKAQQPQSTPPSQAPSQQPESQKINYGKATSVATKNVLGFSLNSLYNNAVKGTSTPVEQPKTIQEEQITEDLPVDIMQLHSEWDRFAESVIKTDNDLYLLLRSTKPQLNGVNINIEVTAAQSQKILGSQELLCYLRKSLHNSQLNINTVIKSESFEQAEHVYTSREKIDKMVEANPSILDLIKEFNLDLEG